MKYEKMMKVPQGSTKQVMATNQVMNGTAGSKPQTGKDLRQVKSGGAKAKGAAY